MLPFGRICPVARFLAWAPPLCNPEATDRASGRSKLSQRQLLGREMTRALFLSRRQAEALLRAAAAERGIVEVKVGGATFRLIPAVHSQALRPIDRPEIDDLDAELAAFEARHGGG